MKFSVVLSMAAGALALNAGTPVKRDGASVASAVAVIQASVTALSNAVNAFAGAADVAGLQAASDATVQAINAGTAVADASAPLAFGDALTLAGPVGDLADQVDATVTALINKEPTFNGLSLDPTVLTALQAQLAAAQAFSTALLAKLGDDTRPIGQGLSDRIIASLNRGIAAFSGTPGSTSTSSGAVTSSTSYSNIWAGYGTSSTTASTTKSTATGWEGYGSSSTTKSTTKSTATGWSGYGTTTSSASVSKSTGWENVVISTITYSTSGWENYYVSTVTYTKTSTNTVPYVSTSTAGWTYATGSAWVEATVKPSSPVKVWTGAAPKVAAGFGAAGLAAAAAVVAAL